MIRRKREGHTLGPNYKTGPGYVQTPRIQLHVHVRAYVRVCFTSRSVYSITGFNHKMPPKCRFPECSCASLDLDDYIKNDCKVHCHLHGVPRQLSGTLIRFLAWLELQRAGIHPEGPLGPPPREHHR